MMAKVSAGEGKVIDRTHTKREKIIDCDAHLREGEVIIDCDAHLREGEVIIDCEYVNI